MNPYENLVGQHFTHEGVRYTVVKFLGDSVVTAYLDNNRVHTEEMGLVDVLERLEVIEIDFTEALMEEEPSEVSGRA